MQRQFVVIVLAVKRLERHGKAEAIIVGRGGGSIEDLWAFNDERVVRAIAACRIPVVSAVGHETDTTLIDFAADLRAPTPSAAAEIVTANYEEFTQKLASLGTRLERAADDMCPIRQTHTQNDGQARSVDGAENQHPLWSGRSGSATARTEQDARENYRS